MLIIDNRIVGYTLASNKDRARNHNNNIIIATILFSDCDTNAAPHNDPNMWLYEEVRS